MAKNIDQPAPGGIDQRLEIDPVSLLDGSSRHVYIRHQHRLMDVMDGADHKIELELLQEICDPRLEPLLVIDLYAHANGERACELLSGRIDLFAVITVLEVVYADVRGVE